MTVSKNKMKMLFAKLKTKRLLRDVPPEISGMLYIRETYKRPWSEPSTIYLDLPAKFANYYESPPYFPNYFEFDENLRWHYLDSLHYILEGTQDIGYVFLYYYGLERQLYEGDFESAYSMIMRLRDIYSNPSFRMYSATALALTCLKNKRFDQLELLLTEHCPDISIGLNIDLYLISKAVCEIPFNVEDVYLYRKSFGYTSNSYATKFPKMFKEFLEVAMTEVTSDEDIDIFDILSISKKVDTMTIHPYANKSLWHVNAEIPIVHEYPAFYLSCKKALDIAHKRSKEYCKFYY